jgi:hypothetical protein
MENKMKIFWKIGEVFYYVAGRLIGRKKESNTKLKNFL